MAACQKGHAHVVKHLLLNHADVMLTNKVMKLDV